MSSTHSGSTFSLDRLMRYILLASFHCVAELRKALGSPGRHNRLIETAMYLDVSSVLQSVRQGKSDQSRYHKLMRKLLEDVKQRAAAGKLLSSSVAGHLLNIRQELYCFARKRQSR